MILPYFTILDLSGPIPYPLNNISDHIWIVLCLMATLTTPTGVTPRIQGKVLHRKLVEQQHPHGGEAIAWAGHHNLHLFSLGRHEREGFFRSSVALHVRSWWIRRQQIGDAKKKLREYNANELGMRRDSVPATTHEVQNIQAIQPRLANSLVRSRKIASGAQSSESWSSTLWSRGNISTLNPVNPLKYIQIPQFAHVKSQKTGEFNECSPQKYRIIARKNGSQALLIKAAKGLVLPGISKAVTCCGCLKKCELSPSHHGFHGFKMFQWSNDFDDFPTENGDFPLLC